MRNKYIDFAINKLGIAFDSLDLTFHQMNTSVPGDVTSYWPGSDDEDILICVFKGKQIHEPFHRQDFFFINYAYKNSYQALSEKYNNLITINEDECYIGQPYSGYALRADSNEDVVIIGVLIRKDSFSGNICQRYIQILPFSVSSLNRKRINFRTNISICLLRKTMLSAQSLNLW